MIVGRTFVLMLFALVATTTLAAEKPEPPLTSIRRPLIVTPRILTQNGVDPDSLSADVCRGYASQARQAGDHEAESQFWYLVVKKTGGDGAYNLACSLSLTGEGQGALYWLQKAAEVEGVDPEWAANDPDLQNAQLANGWARLQPYLREYVAYWRESGVEDHSLVLPKNYDGKPIPVFVWLHGYGDHASSYAGEREQSIADSNRIAFVCVSGTYANGPTSFQWAEQPLEDRVRVREAMRKFAGKFVPDRDHVAIGGFSQGAVVAAQLLAQHPDTFSGAIILSPGAVSDDPEVTTEVLNEIPGSKVVCLCGDGEHPGNVELTKLLSELFSDWGADVEMRLTPGQDYHGFPPDFDGRRGVTWIRKTLGL